MELRCRERQAHNLACSKSRMSAVGTESEDEVEEVEEPYEASIADDDEVPGKAIDDLEEFFPGELAPDLLQP